MNLKNAGHHAMYGAFAGAALGSLTLLLGFHSINPTICALQYCAIIFFGATIGLAIAYGPSRLLSHIHNLLVKTRRSAKRLLKYGLGILIVALLWVVGSFIYARYEPNIWLYKLRSADRIIVRDGGFNCCGSVDDEAVLFEVKDPVEIKNLLSNIEFAGKKSPCMCCGFPGIDWYQGSDRIALTSMQHGKALRYHGGDLRLTDKASKAIASWLVKHDVSAKEIESGCGGPRRDIRRQIPLLKLAQACLARGENHAEKGDLDKALQEFTKALNHKPGFALAYYKRGLAHEKNGDLDEAISDLNDAIIFDRTKATTLKINRDKKIEEYCEALGLNEKRAIAHFIRGRCYEKKGDKAKSEDDFSKAKELGYNPK